MLKKILKKILNQSPGKLLFFLLLTSFILRIARIDYPNAYVFDEVYHAFTAKQYLEGSKQAWEWWTTPPPGVAFEWTHPPLAKLFMTASMFIFQSTDSWAWRLPGVLAGTISIYLVYQIALYLFKTSTLALLSALIFSLDGLNFVQSRTGMNDAYLVMFVLFTLYIALKQKYLFSAILFGLAAATKWSAIYTLPILLLILFHRKKSYPLLYLVLIPPAVYLLTYLPFFIIGHSWEQFIELQRQMWYYHTHLQATHDYASPWWSWPLNLYPVWYFVDYQKDTISNIFASGNPLVFWSGLTAIFLTSIEAVIKRDFKLSLILFAYFAFLLPWSVSPRIMFLYHYSPCIPFLSIALGYQLNSLTKNPADKKYLLIFLFLLILGFLIFYPLLTGIPLPKNLSLLFFQTNLTKNPF